MQNRIDRLHAEKPGLQAINAVLHLPEMVTENTPKHSCGSQHRRTKKPTSN